MKKQIMVLAALVISGTFAAQAQVQNDKPSKGYYSIGKNAGKSKKSASRGITISRSEEAPSVQKGYYSIAGNKRKLQKPIAVHVSVPQTPPSKGYYGIGNNAEKLKQ